MNRINACLSTDWVQRAVYLFFLAAWLYYAHVCNESLRNTFAYYGLNYNLVWWALLSFFVLQALLNAKIIWYLILFLCTSASLFFCWTTTFTKILPLFHREYVTGTINDLPFISMIVSLFILLLINWLVLKIKPVSSA